MFALAIMLCLTPTAAGQCGVAATGYIPGNKSHIISTDMTWQECCTSCVAPCRGWSSTQKNNTGTSNTCLQFTTTPPKPKSCRTGTCRTGTRTVPEPTPSPHPAQKPKSQLNTDNIIAAVVGAGIMCIISVCMFSIIRFVKYRKKTTPTVRQTLLPDNETANTGDV